ncbi:cytochrome c biogenesis protein ResB [Ornithinimicrobium humiphilum]|uniref:Cytochrome c biogenesis protein n=1 Tax=Ornithinimicrobium humiphilum TaxID=125288 RepID=A0A543KKJ3_9MICO|nr:cytochrome c biogenesis protein ResB [Ornithinimicrobium humiphilum]TQM95607.1 cytochrome c biogenesis protein [Ornithinimicrobium humiphilum]
MAETRTPERIEPSYPKDRTALGGPRLGLVGWLRWIWRQLTSMRTALALLLLLAVAAIPGSIFPQRGVDPVRVRRYLEDNPDVGPWLDRIGMFDVYSSPWFASIYLLLMISLVGCILPRSRQHLDAMRAEPPKAPSRLTRMPVHRTAVVDADPAEVVAAARAELGRRRFRLRAEDDGELVVSGEKGYLKETGNLLFHLAILGVIVSVAVGHLFGWRGEIIVKEGETVTTGASAFDTLHLGPLVDPDDIPVFSLRLNDLDVQFEAVAEGAQFGQPRVFEGVATVQEGLDGAVRTVDFAVNDPLHVGGTSIFLLGNGYAPVVTVRDAEGEILFSDAVTFLPQDNVYSSEGVIKVPGADPSLGFVGGFLPTLTFDPEIGPTSSFPGLVDPALVLAVFEGDLYPEGRPQSVFSLDTDSMEQVMQDDGTPVSLLIRPGDELELAGDRGSIELETVIRWGGLMVRHDPGRLPALAFAGIALLGLGLMLGVRRRRVFVRVAPGTADADGAGARHTEVTVAGLPKGTDPGLEELVEQVLARTAAACGGRTGTDKDDE